MRRVLLFITISLPVMTGCRKDKLDDTDQEAFDGMEEAFYQARSYNNSLIHCDQSGSCTQTYILYCDSLFHHYVELWDYHHEQYNHDHYHSDHYHEGHNMHHDSNQNNHDNEEGHHAYHHELMDELMDDHEPYHP